MENRAKLKYEELKKMIFTLNKSIDLVAENTLASHDRWLKDSVIQRFEYTIEWIWKFLKYFLLEEHWEVQSTPMLIIKTAYKAWIINNIKDFKDMIERRNRLSHDYHEDFAELSFEIIVDEYIDYINNFLDTIKKHYE